MRAGVSCGWRCGSYATACRAVLPKFSSSTLPYGPPKPSAVLIWHSSADSFATLHPRQPFKQELAIVCGATVFWKIPLEVPLLKFEISVAPSTLNPKPP